MASVVSTDSPVNAAFLGGGFMTAVHSRAVRLAGAIPYAVVSSSPAASFEAATRYGIAKPYESISEMLADPLVNVVHVNTPNAMHFEHTMAALEAGKHVVCEKPLATTPSDAQKMLAAATAAGVVATVPFTNRFHPMIREARERVISQKVGKLSTIHGHYLQDWMSEPTDDNWRARDEFGGPSRAFADIGSHLCDLLEFVTAEHIVRVNAITSTVYPERNSREITSEDAVALIVQLQSGAIGSLLISQVAAGRKNSLTIEVTGSAESLRFEQEAPDTLWIGRRRGTEILARDESLIAPDAARLSLVPVGHPMGYQDAFNAFVRDSYAAILGAKHDGLPSFADGYRSAQVTAAVLASAQTGHWVDVTG